MVAEDIKKAARFSVHVTWKDGTTEKTIPVTQWIYNQASKNNMPPTPWIYNGSYIYEKKFDAKLSGSIITIFPNIGAIANYSGEDRNDDNLWSPSANTPEGGNPGQGHLETLASCAIVIEAMLRNTMKTLLSIFILGPSFCPVRLRTGQTRTLPLYQTRDCPGHRARQCLPSIQAAQRGLLG